MTELTPKHVHVRRVDGFRHEATVRHHSLVIDEPEHLGGADTAASPLELLAASVAACTASTIEMYAERKGWELGGVEVAVIFTPPHALQPGRFDVVLTLPEGLDESQLKRLELIARKCPVRRTLEGAVVTDRVEVAP